MLKIIEVISYRATYTKVHKIENYDLSDSLIGPIGFNDGQGDYLREH